MSSDIRIDANTEGGFHDLDMLKSKNIVPEQQPGDLTSAPTVERGPNGDKGQRSLPPNYIKGWKLHVISVGLCIPLFLANMEIPIVTTSIVGITNDLQGFSQSSWLTAAYLLTYVGFLIIWAKLSDIFGRKSFASLATFVFVVFSGACGAAQTITQLIVFRALQGIGGAGIYAVYMAIFFELVPPEAFPKYASIISSVYAFSLVLGPVLAGVFNDSGKWRWIFLLNVPMGTVAVIVLLVILPSGFPNLWEQSAEKSRSWKIMSVKGVEKVDFLGSILLLIATVFLVAALEEAGTRFPWRSPFVITLLTVSGILWVLFLAWERKVTRASRLREPVFPWRFIQSRVWIGMMLNALFLGGPFFVAIFQLPQRSQIVAGVSPLMAGVRLLPFTVSAPLGSIMASIVAGKAKIPPIYLVIGASSLQVIGFALLSTLPSTNRTLQAQYGYEVIAGLGCGVNISTLMLMTPFSVEKKDQAVALSTVTQFRVMGGAIGLAIVTTVLNSFVRSNLSKFLTPEEVGGLLQTASALDKFPTDIQRMIQGVFAQGYNTQFKILAGLAAAQIPSSAMMWQKNQIVL